MMLQPTEREIELFQKLKETTDECEKNKIRLELKEITIKQKKKLKDCPFCHF